MLAVVVEGDMCIDGKGTDGTSVEATGCRVWDCIESRRVAVTMPLQCWIQLGVLNVGLLTFWVGDTDTQVRVILATQQKWEKGQKVYFKLTRTMIFHRYLLTCLMCIVGSGGSAWCCPMTCSQAVGQHSYFKVLFDVSRTECARNCCENEDCVVFNYNKVLKGKVKFLHYDPG